MKVQKNKYILGLLGALLLCYYIWYRFIRERLPRDIPFNLSNSNFIFLVLICISYIYIISRLIRSEPNNKVINKVLSNILLKLQTIFISLNQVIRENIFIKNKLKSIILSIISLLNTATLYSNNAKRIFYIYFYLTKVQMLVIFLIDIFVFKQIYYSYYFLILTISSPLITYGIYTLKLFQQDYFIILKDYLIEITSEDDETIMYYLNPSEISYDDIVETEFDIRYKYLSIEHFIKLQTTAIMWEDTPYSYHCLHKSERKDVTYLSGCPKFNVELSSDQVNKLISSLIDFHIILETIAYLKKRLFIKICYISLYTIYLITWLYILTTADYINVSINILKIMINIQNTEEPFSNSPLDN